MIEKYRNEIQYRLQQAWYEYSGFQEVTWLPSFLMIIWLTSISSFEYSVSEPKVVDDFQKQIFMVLNVRMEYLNSEQKTFILHGRSVNKFWEDQR